MKINIFLIIILLSFFIFSCNNKEEKVVDKNAIAGVNEDYLYKKDIIKLLPKHISSEDSAKLVSEFIHQWVADKVIYLEAQKVLTDTAIIEQKIKEYREQLYSYYYQQNHIYNNVNFNVTFEEIEEYYNKHLQDYVLSKTYVKAHYMTIDSEVYTYYQERDKLFNSEAEDKEELEDFTIGTGRRVYFVEEWTELGDFLHEVKYDGQFDANELLFRSTFEHIEGELRYLVKFDDYKTIGDYMPIEIAEGDIAQIIVNNRKRDKLIQKQNELIEKGLKDGYVIIKEK